MGNLLSEIGLDSGELAFISEFATVDPELGIEVGYPYVLRQDLVYAGSPWDLDPGMQVIRVQSLGDVEVVAITTNESALAVRKLNPFVDGSVPTAFNERIYKVPNNLEHVVEIPAMLWTIQQKNADFDTEEKIVVKLKDGSKRAIKRSDPLASQTIPNAFLDLWRFGSTYTSFKRFYPRQSFL